LPSLRHAVAVCADILSALGAGLAVTRPGPALEPLLGDDGVVAELEELQFTLGQGPAMDVAVSGTPERVADLTGTEAGRRWPVFTQEATVRGVHGVFAFPVGAGAAMLGVLTVYRHQAGPLDTDQWLDALVIADALFVLALDHRRGLSPDLHEVIDAAFTARRAEVHQAAGRVAAQNGIGVADALARLRAHAYGTGLSLHEVAADVMTGGLRLDTDHETPEDLG